MSTCTGTEAYQILSFRCSPFRLFGSWRLPRGMPVSHVVVEIMRRCLPSARALSIRLLLVAWLRENPGVMRG